MLRRNTATVAGAVTTFVLVIVFAFAPEVIPFELFQETLYRQTGIWLDNNPFTTLRYLSGFGGGFVAGYLTKSRMYEAPPNAMHALVVALFGYYVLILVSNLATFFSVLSPSVFLVLVFQPLLFVILPYTLLFVFEALISCLLGWIVMKVLHIKVTQETVPASSRQILRGIRATVATLTFTTGFMLVWWASFHLERVY